jgi:NAD(P)-dependent dehydrogenase (short-subunit alcohol dehydrogenase family)
MRSLTELQNLDGCRTLVTGGAGHIGRAAAETLLEFGVRVALLDCDGAACETRAKELGRQFDAEVAHLTAISGMKFRRVKQHRRPLTVSTVWT